MLATIKAAIKAKIVLIGQSTEANEPDLPADEGPFQSQLAVAQDLWGTGNLTPLDNAIASCALRALAVNSKSSFGVACHQLGRRLFKFNRESGNWIDAYEGEPALSEIEKRPKDKLKLIKWSADAGLPKDRYTDVAILQPSRMPAALPKVLRDGAAAVKPTGHLFFADLVARGDRPERIGGSDVRPLAECRQTLIESGLKPYNEFDLSGEIASTMLAGLANSVGMLKIVRGLRDPWKTQRLAAFLRELDCATALHQGLASGTIACTGLLFERPKG